MTQKPHQGNPFPLQAARAACLTLHFLWFSIAIVLLPVSASTQALPDAPAPASPAAQVSSSSSAGAPSPVDWMWRRIQQISDGQFIVVRTVLRGKVRCTFEGATETTLYCDPPGVLSSRPAYQFNRASVLSVREIRPGSDAHPGLLAASLITGTAVGIVAAGDSPAPEAVAAGLLTTLIVAGVGSMVIQLNRRVFGMSFAFQPHGLGRGLQRGHWTRPRMPIRPMH